VVQEYTQLGGHITEESPFGIDPLHGDVTVKMQRDQEFCSRLFSFEAVANAINNHQEDFFEQAIEEFVNITFNLA
jgi:hypothetical protein